MIKMISQIFNGCISLLLYTINTLFWALPMFIIALLKFLVPLSVVRNYCRITMNYLANSWILFNKLNQKFFSYIQWDIKGVEKLSMKGWYMVVANHQSWVDILVLQNIFHNKIPFLKFFIKKELIWFPILGQTWWALEFPFVKRYSKNKLNKNPKLIGKDLEITKNYCKKLAQVPTSIMNFVEGTRFSIGKHNKQKSKYKNLLRAKAGGLAFVMEAMSNKLQKIIDVTIVYPNNNKSFWDFVCGRIGKIKVRVKVRPIEDHMIGDYLKDYNYRKSFQNWLNDIWMEKDKYLTDLVSK